MEATQVRSRQPQDDEAAAPVQHLVVIVGESADGGSAYRVEDPARLLRVSLMLQATLEQLEGITLPREGMPGLQRQLHMIRREFERTVSPPVAAELARILPPRDAAPSAGALRIECAVLASWIGSLVTRMLAVLAVARERSGPAAAASTDAGAARGSPE
ncbi:MAG TPA: proteasome activator [Streptosporangiaceae bacterium]|nr:proteasome activator [Streptosporangiaceae bacterium]